MNSQAIGRPNGKSARSATNRIATTRQMNKALPVQQPMARLITVIRRSRMWSSRIASASASPSRPAYWSSSRRQRSTERARRPAMTLRIEPIPASRKTGAIASEMRCAIAETGAVSPSKLLAHVEDEDGPQVDHLPGGGEVEGDAELPGRIVAVGGAVDLVHLPV